MPTTNAIDTLFGDTSRSAHRNFVSASSRSQRALQYSAVPTSSSSKHANCKPRFLKAILAVLGRQRKLAFLEIDIFFTGRIRARRLCKAPIVHPESKISPCCTQLPCLCSLWPSCTPEISSKSATLMIARYATTNT